MISIFEVLDKNKAEAIAILKTKENKQIDFAKWDDEAHKYVCEGDEDVETACPWIRMSYDDGEIRTEIVVSVRYNESKPAIEIQSTEGQYTNTVVWYPLDYADDISYWSVYETIGEYA